MKVSVLYFFVFCIAYSSAVYKKWMSNTDFGSDMNWDVNRSPCGNDVVYIEEESPIVYVQENATMKALILPKTGEIIMGPNAGLGFTSAPADDCKDVGGDLHFAALNPKPWMNRDNWCATLTERGECDSSRLLDVDYVPCRYDSVIFPPNHGFFVDLSENTPDMSIRSLKISRKTYRTEAFANFTLNDPDGKRMFHVGTSSESSVRVTITNKACTAKAGCPCGNDQPQISEKICAYKKESCDRPQCSKSILPVGMCCRLCGVSFNMTMGYGFNFEKFKTNLNKDFFSDQKDVTNIVAMMSGGWVQVVLTDADGKKSKDLARALQAGLDKDLSDTGHRYMIKDYLLSMDEIPTGSHANRSKSPMSGGSIAAIVLSIIIILLIIAVIVVIFVYRRTGRTLPRIPGMAHIPGLNRIPGLYVRRVFSRGDPNAPQTAAHIDPGFANPMYDSSPLDDDFVMKEMEMIGAIQEEQPTFEASNAGFQNPLYGKTKASGFKDPSKVDTPGEEATTSGVATTPASGASTGSAAHSASVKTGGSGGGKGSKTKAPTAVAADETGVILDFSDTTALNTDSTI